MKITGKIIAGNVLLLLLPAGGTVTAQQLSAKEIIKKTDEKFNGELS